MRRLRFEARDLAAARRRADDAAGHRAAARPAVQRVRGLERGRAVGAELFPIDAPPARRDGPGDGPVCARCRTRRNRRRRPCNGCRPRSAIGRWPWAHARCARSCRRWCCSAATATARTRPCCWRACCASSGIDARPALASLATRNGPASMLPAPEVFDHVIVQARLAGREYYLDPTRHGQAGLLSRMGQRLEEAAVLPVDADTQDLVIVRSPNRAEIFRNQLHERLSLARFGDEGRLEVEIRWFGLNAETLAHVAAAHGCRPTCAASFPPATCSSTPAAAWSVSPGVSDDRRLNQLTISASFAVPRLARAAGEQWGVPFAPSLGDAIVLPQRLSRRFPLAVPSFPGHLPLPRRHGLARRHDARRRARIAAPGDAALSSADDAQRSSATARAARSNSRPRSTRCRRSRYRAWSRTWAGWHARSAA